MEENELFRPKVTYLAKDETICPVCENSFYRELMLSKGGRLQADIITDTLHRLYKPSKKFGEIYPLAYSIITCPNCLFTSLVGDFNNPVLKNKEEINDKVNERIDFVKKIIGEQIDFLKYKTLESAAAGYAIAVECYDNFSRKQIPVIKQAICSIRAAYLFEELEKKKPNQYFDYVSELYYKKALFFYKRAIELEQRKEQIIGDFKAFGPDIDKNYGYDSVIYLIGILTFKYGRKDDKELRKKDLEEARLYLGKLFGLGKADFKKPKEILEKSKDFHKLISDEIKEIDEQY
jgi:uncharacterized protein (DUF2225 family)